MHYRILALDREKTPTANTEGVGEERFSYSRTLRLAWRFMETAPRLSEYSAVLVQTVDEYGTVVDSHDVLFEYLCKMMHEELDWLVLQRVEGQVPCESRWEDVHRAITTINMRRGRDPWTDLDLDELDLDAITRAVAKEIYRRGTGPEGPPPLLFFETPTRSARFFLLRYINGHVRARVVRMIKTFIYL